MITLLKNKCIKSNTTLNDYFPFPACQKKKFLISSLYLMVITFLVSEAKHGFEVTVNQTKKMRISNGIVFLKIKSNAEIIVQYFVSKKYLFIPFLLEYKFHCTSYFILRIWIYSLLRYMAHQYRGFRLSGQTDYTRTYGKRIAVDGRKRIPGAVLTAEYD